ncbi:MULTISPECIES: hypothetical protein [unclassified Lentilitoribacter]|uniref:hypothetical protein n=1 Tax=unclassified Lentilitoribacter TaxID=2647570 RepID=UPI0013A6B38B|nr:hypothetical protein [Lentilitoribacter sp. Alg239-R112]
MAHSAAYLLHTGRKGLWSFEKGSKLAFLAQHSNDEKSMLVLPAGASNIPDHWARVCEHAVGKDKKSP